MAVAVAVRGIADGVGESPGTSVGVAEGSTVRVLVDVPRGGPVQIAVTVPSVGDKVAVVPGVFSDGPAVTVASGAETTRGMRQRPGSGSSSRALPDARQPPHNRSPVGWRIARPAPPAKGDLAARLALTSQMVTSAISSGQPTRRLT